jgi:hypothetical protein
LSENLWKEKGRGNEESINKAKARMTRVILKDQNKQMVQ